VHHGAAAYGGLGDAERKRELLERALAALMIKERECGIGHREVAYSCV